jgi:hydrogenase-4 component F
VIAWVLVVLPLLAGAALLPRRARPAALTVLLAVSGALALAAVLVALVPPPVVRHELLVVDATSRLFVAVVNAVFFGISAHVGNRARQEKPFRRRAMRFARFGLPFIAFANLAVLSEDLLLGWCALEMTTFLAVPLVADDRSGDKLPISWQYFLFSTVGLTLVLAGFGCLQRALGPDVSLAYDALAANVSALASPWGRLGVALVVAGYGTKLGLFPMNTWLPPTYASAPAPVTALLGAVQFNVALVGLLRVLAVFGAEAPPGLQQQLLWTGMLSMGISTLGIVTTRDYVRLLGYASINHAGVIAVGLGLGGPAAYGVLLYVVSNAFIKAILFLTAGRVQARFHTRDARDVHGLVKAMPFSGAFLMVGTFALLGLPPFGSFLGELLILSSVVESGRLALLFPFCALLAVSFVATGRTLFPMIWGEPPVSAPATSPGRGDVLSEVVPKGIFLVALVALGIYIPAPVNALLQQVAASLGAR